ncbi:MAG: histidine phosphatase family protein [Pseudomonadota bacterium]
MTRTLIVLRHAKSSWGDPGLTDHARPLNKRGRASAKAIGDWLTYGGFAPDQVLCSDARRAQETWEHSGLTADVQMMPHLYLSEAETLLSAVQQATGQCVMVIAHNPGIADFADRIVTAAPTHDRFADYPTAATLVAGWNGDWADLTFGNAIARAFTVPRDLIS